MRTKLQKPERKLTLALALILFMGVVVGLSATATAGPDQSIQVLRQLQTP